MLAATDMGLAATIYTIVMCIGLAALFGYLLLVHEDQA